MLWDGDENIIENVKQDFMSVDKNNEIRYGAYFCSYCFKRFFDDYKNLKAAVRIHHSRCQPLFKDGITKITSLDLDDERIKQAIQNIGRISMVAQHLDFIVTSTEKIRFTDDETSESIVHVYVENGKILGFIMSCLRQFDNCGGWVPFVQDFYVVEYRRRQGIGRTLLRQLEKEYNSPVGDMVFDSPSMATVNLVNKYFW